jgi:serine/threonine-protein kinase
MTKGSDLELGQVVVGKYRLLDVLGEGGMGIVYLAEHELIEKSVALKVLRREYSGKAELVQRFKQEAISASRIKHPNVLDVFDFGQLENGCFFLAMEYLQGHDLAAELASNTTVEPVRAVRLALQMCRALGAAHARGVVHRDMKPENIFLHTTEDGDEIVKIVDFGIAQLRGREDKKIEEMPRRRLTRTGVIFGTPEYMSPEQAAGRAADLRVDVYAMGVILYEMFTGAVPFTGESFMAVLSAHLTNPVTPLRTWVPDLAISSDLEAAIMVALAKNPDERYQSMAEFGQALHHTPEGRLAAPLAALLPIPKVTHNTFRPARGPATSTSPQFATAAPNSSSRIGIEAKSVATLVGVAESIGEGEAVGSSQTDIAGAAPKRRRMTISMLAALLLLAAAAGAWVKVSQGRVAKFAPDPATPVNSSPPAPVVISAPPANALPSASPTPSGAMPVRVAMSITTEPAGAVLFKNGFQVCDSTPCTLEAQQDEGMELEGQKGALKGTLRVLAQRDQSVNIVLQAAPASVNRSAKRAAPKAKLCEVVVEGLKILRPCP